MKIPLTQNQFAVIDDEDYPLIAPYKWTAAWSKWTKTFYAQTHAYIDGKRVTLPMHRVILRLANSKKVVDHVNHDTLDNRKQNIRACTHSQNAANRGKAASNTSGFKGVHLRKDTQRWRAFINEGGKKKYLGYFESAELAHKAYIDAANRIYGQFAKVD